MGRQRRLAVCAVEVIIDFRMRSVRIQSTKKGGLHRPIIKDRQ